MPDRLFNSGRRWLKLIVFGSTALLLLFVGMTASVYHVFSHERIQSRADAALKDTRRSVRFDEEIGRSWFPRPTLTLHNLIISRPDRRDAAIHIKRAQIGFAWRSLWQQEPVIEKWQAEGAEIRIEREADGSWSLQDLWQLPGREMAVNRVNMAGSRLTVRVGQADYVVEDFGINLQAPVSDGRRFRIIGTLPHDAHPLAWQGQGMLKASAEGWQIPAFTLNAQSRLNQHPVNISAEAALRIDVQAQTLYADDTALRADSSYPNGHLSVQIPQWSLQPERLHLNTLSGAFTAEEGGQQWDAAVKLDKAVWRPGIATLDSAEIKGRYKTVYQQTQFTAAGNLMWQHSRGVKAEQLQLTAWQESLTDPAPPRYNTNLQGSVEWSGPQAWQGGFTGLFDRQPLALKLRYHAEEGRVPVLEAGLALQKLNLIPYWQSLQSSGGKAYPALFEHPRMPELDANLRIGSIQIPGLQLDDVETHLQADRSRLALSRFQAGLYGGRTQGGLVVTNTEIPSYHLQQNARGVRIRPLLRDLFGFHTISGNGDADIDLRARGRDRQSLSASLNGSLSLNISDGHWHGIDLNNILQSGKVGQAAADRQTPFRRFTLSSTITDGIGYHENTELTSDSLYVTGSGYTDFAKQELAENLLIRNPRYPRAKPVPLKISGPVDNPSVTLDYNRLTDGLSTPEEKQKALADTLKEQWKWLSPPSGQAEKRAP
ncbi:AsmA family protein [Bergeriella denitrificans]|nr:AsmA family protein [Bergeriella denitrificans]